MDEEVSPPRGPVMRRANGLPAQRRALGFACGIVGLPLLTAALLPVRGSLAEGSFLLVYLLAVVGVAVVGGLVPALLTAVASFLLVNWFLTPPYYTFSVASRDAAVDLVVFALVGAVVSIAVELGARHREAAARNEYESILISELGSAQVGAVTLTAVLERVRATFDMDTVRLIDPEQPARVLASVGPDAPTPPSLEATTASGLSLVAHGPPVFAEDRRLFGVLADLAARAWEEQELAKQAARADQLAETDRVRSGLLSAVGHDLRTPLAGIKAAVSSLRQRDIPWTDQDRDELLEAVEESADRLTALIENLLSMSRLQVGAVSVHPEPVAVDEVVARALLHDDPRVRVDVPEDLPLVWADAGLLERVLANLLDNALRHTPEDTHVDVRAVTSPPAPGTTDETAVHILVADHGPGIAPTEWRRIFAPFQRFGDRNTGAGVGLGLAIARGFTEAMHGTVTPSATPGGGLTMTLSLPVAP